jgi:polysaccharide biosynthesis protein VpsM
MDRTSLFITLCLLAFPVGEACAAAQHEVAVDKLIVVAANNPEDGSGAAQDMPMGQSAEENVPLLPEESGATGADFYGSEGGYFHPYLSVKGSYTDNVFNVDSDKTSSFITRISPGIWLTLPRKKIVPVSINTTNVSPGGLQQQIEDPEGTDRYQVYALAGADLFFYSESSDLNTTDGFLEGLGRYNMASGLSLQLLDRYSLGHDTFGAGISTSDLNLREYDNNLVKTTADWDLTQKVRVKINYSNFILAYKDSINDFLERQDNAVDVYGYYKYSVKTSFFAQYRYTAVGYDSATEKDNTQNYFYGGLRWGTTEKLALMLKAGLQKKEYDNKAPGFSKSNNLIVDIQTLYRFTEKTQATLDVYRQNEEPDSADASQIVVFGTRLGYSQKITEKITGKFNFNYEKDNYTQLTAASRDDNSFTFRPSVQYHFKDWLISELSYRYKVTNSSNDIYDYATNTVFLSLNLAL